MIPEELRTGHEIIDTQHNSILTELNLLKKVLDEGGLSTPVVLEFVTFLRNHFTDHFTDEEVLMHRLNYPAANLHVDEHLKFFDVFIHTRAKILANGATTENIDNLVSSLSGWLTDHILSTDVLLARFVRGEKLPEIPMYERGY
jgi:hemerythrin-like metal-binding protein